MQQGPVIATGPFFRVEPMPIRHMDHVGIVVDDLAAATEFFVALGLRVQGEGSVEGEWADRIVGLDGLHSDLVMLETADGRRCLELVKFNAPPSPPGDRAAPPHAPGIRHLSFEVDDVDATVAAAQAHGAELVGEIVRYGDAYRLCYLRGPAGIIVELAEPLSAG